MRSNWLSMTLQTLIKMGIRVKLPQDINFSAFSQPLGVDENASVTFHSNEIVELDRV